MMSMYIIQNGEISDIVTNMLELKHWCTDSFTNIFRGQKYIDLAIKSADIEINLS